LFLTVHPYVIAYYSDYWRLQSYVIADTVRITAVYLYYIRVYFQWSYVTQTDKQADWTAKEVILSVV